jgi:hypothetical protein
MYTFILWTQIVLPTFWCYLMLFLLHLSRVIWYLNRFSLFHTWTTILLCWKSFIHLLGFLNFFKWNFICALVHHLILRSLRWSKLAYFLFSCLRIYLSLILTKISIIVLVLAYWTFSWEARRQFLLFNTILILSLAVKSWWLLILVFLWYLLYLRLIIIIVVFWFPYNKWFS